MNRHGGTTNAPLTILKSAGNLLSSRGTSTTSGQKPLIFETLNSKRKALGFAAISSQRIFAGFSNGCKKATYRGNTGSRARRSLMNRKEVENASRLAESRDRHGFWWNARTALQRRFI